MMGDKKVRLKLFTKKIRDKILFFLQQNSNLIYPPPSIQPGMDYLPSTESSGSGDGRKSKSKSSVLYWILFSVILVIVLVVIMGVVMVYMVLSAELKASKSADATRPTLAAGSHVEPEEVTIELKEQSEIQKDAKKSIIRAATTMTERGNKIIFGTDLKSTGQRLKRQALITSGSNPAEGKLHPELLAARGRAEADTDRPKSECRRRVLPMCARTVPFNSTTYPNLIGDQNEFEARRSLPFFNLIARSNCNRRLKQLLCVLLEPPCHDGRALPPCKKFCRVALEGCAEHIPATLELSSVFDCRQYPDSTDPHTCVNLAIGRTCASDEYQCPDKSCIPRHWLCDGVRDCIFAADETNCTNAVNHYSQSACSTEEFQCDGKCVPTTWRCDGDRDCLDGSDEMNCSSKPGCGADRFKCHDGFGCIPKRWVCDGKAECRDGSDEQNCERQGGFIYK